MTIPLKSLRNLRRYLSWSDILQRKALKNASPPPLQKKKKQTNKEEAKSVMQF